MLLAVLVQAMKNKQDKGDKLGYRLDTIDAVKNIFGIEYCYLIDREGVIHAFEGDFEDCFSITEMKGVNILVCLKEGIT